jgi:predicted MFS family arabinose efflux permease
LLTGTTMEPGASDRLTKVQWLLLLVLAGVQFTNVLDFVVMMPLAIQFHEEWHLTPKEFAALVASYSLAAAISGILSTWFIDRLDRKRSVLMIYSGFILANILCATAVNYWAMLGARAAAGMFGGILGGTILAIVGDVIPMARRGLATGIVMSSFSVASIIGIPLSLKFAQDYNWRWPFAGIAVLSTVLLILAWWKLPTFRGHLKHQVPDQNPWHNIWSLISDPNLLRAYLLMGVMIITTFTIVPFLPNYLVANANMAREDLWKVYFYGGIGTLVAMPLIGKLSDRFGKLLVFQILATVTAVPMLAVTHLPPCPLLVILLVTTLMMTVTSSRSVPAMALITACTTPQKRGGFMSVMGSTNQLSMGIATLLAGSILGVTALPEQPNLATKPGIQLDPIKPLEGFPIVGWISCVLTLSTVYLATRLRTPEGKLIEAKGVAGANVEAAKDHRPELPGAEIDVKQGV